MKVQLIVVQGKPEGKIIPLQIPTFRIGRDDTCHLRPNSEQVSREHAEFTITPEKVVVRDLGSRNGTFVNNQVLTAPYTLKDRDLIQVGALTFAISIEGAPVSSSRNVPEDRQAKKALPDDVNNADIESWLIADIRSPTPDRPSGVYTGETQMFDTSQQGKSPEPDPSRNHHEPPPDSEVEAEAEAGDDEGATGAGETSEEFIDDANPFSKAKPQSPVKPAYKDSSDAASDILKKLMDRRRVPH
jgi:pSer/pThr/pTyr-binding forkhead associated (FHA) protein